MKKIYSILMFGTLLILGLSQQISAQQTLVHPGIAFNQADLNQLKANITKEPWLSAYNSFKNDNKSKLSYVMAGPYATVSRAPHLNNNAWINDMVAIKNLTFMYVFTGDIAYAKKATDMLDAWAVVNTYWGGIENNLDIGDHAQDWGVAAEILRYTYPGWTAANTQHVENYFANVLFPTSFVPNPLRDQNKGAIQLKTALAASIFCNDLTRFNQALEVYRMDAGGGMRNSLPNGEVGDSGRDDHWQVQATALVWGAEVAWKQKIDMFSELDNRVLAIAELYHQFAFDGDTMTYIPFGGYASYWTSWGIKPGGRPWGMTNIIHNAYNRRLGIPTPQTDRMRSALGGTQGDFLYLKSSDTSTAVPLPPVLYPSEHVQPVSSGLTNIDIGNTGLAGSASFNNGIWTLKGAGNSTSNALSFNFKKVSGDVGLIIKVNSMSLTTGGSGVMLRESLEPGSRFWDLSLGAINGVARHGQPKAPWWLKIERVNNRIFAYHSHDGVNWTNTSCWYSATGFPTELYLGFYTLSNNTSLHNTATFSNVGYSQSAPTGSPEISSATTATTTIGLPFSYSINASANPTAYSVSGLPAGLSLDAATGIISGTPTELGQKEVALTATNTSGSGTATLILKVLNDQAPAAITSAVVSIVNTTQIKLSWPISANATSYSVKRSLTSGGPYTTIQAGINLTSFTDPSPAYEVNNYYVITAFTGNLESGNSNEVFANVPPAIPGRPVATNQSDRINLAWDAVSSASSYKVKRGIASGGPYTTIATVGTNSYTDTDVTNGSPYYYVLSSVGATLESANSPEAFGTPGASSAEWSSTPLSTSFNLATNWTGNTLPVNPAILTFRSTTDSLLTNDLTDLVASRIQFASDADSYTISGNGLALKNDLVNNSSKTQTFTTPLLLTDQLSVETGGGVVLNGAISGTGSLRMNSWGNLYVNGSNSTYSGNTSIIHGKVVASGNCTGTPSNPTAGPFGTGKIILNGGLLQAPPDAGLSLYNDIEVLPGDRSSLYEDYAAINLYGKLSGSGNVAHDGNYYAGLNLHGDNSEFSGTFTTIFRSGAHRLRFMSPESGSAKADWLLDANAPDCQNLSFKTGTIHFGTLRGRGYIRTAGTNSPVISIGARNSYCDYGGTIDALGGNLTVEKVGTGTLRMYGNQLYNGTTTVKKGKLSIENAPASGVFNSPIIVQEGALGGTGVIQSSATIGTGSGPGAILEPGVSKIGTLKVGALIMKADATYTAEINLENGTGDKVTATSVTLLNSPVLSISSIAGTLPSGTAYTLIDNTGTLPIDGTFKDLPEMSLVNKGGYDFRITYVGGTGNDIQLLDERATQTNGLASEMYYIKIASTNSFLTKNMTSNTPAFDTLSADKTLQRWKISKETNGKYKISSIVDAPAGYNNYINENAQFGTDAYDMTLNTMNIYRNGLLYAIQGAGNGYWYVDGNIIRTQQDSTSSSTPSSFPFELVLDIYYSLETKLDEAKAVRDAAQTSTTQEAGKYPVEAKQNFSNTIDSTIANYGSLTTVNQVNNAIIMLTTAISDFKNTIYINKNQLTDGSYYIKIPNSGLYWTKNGTNTPTFETVNSDQSIQHWNVTKQSNGLYKITCASSPSSYQNYINENAQFAVNSYDAIWNTMNIFFNGTTYAIQRTQNSGNGYWYVSGNKIMAQGGATNSSVPSSFPLELVLDFKYALESKINEAKIIRDQLLSLTTTTQELGKYPLTKWESLNSAINTAVSRYNTITSATEAATEVSNLDLAIVSLKESMYYKANELANGNYYIKIPNTESYWTKNTTNIPLFAALNTDRSIQIWNITKQSNGRYKISHISTPNTSYQSYINENAQFGKNVYDARWNTMNIYFNGTTYAIQRAQNSGTGFWNIVGTTLGSGPSATTPTSFPILLVPVDGLQIITFNTLSNKTMGGADFEGGAITTSGLAVSYTSSNPAVATIVNGKIHIVGSGTTNITASQAGNATYSPATTVTQALTVLKNSQIITFNPLPDKTMGDADFDAAATTSSGLAVTYSSSDTSVATIVNDKVHIIGAGTSIITASQVGSEEFNAATSVSQVLTVVKKEQSITFATIEAKILGDTDFDGTATASSNLTVSYSSSNPNVATIVDGKIHLVGTGTSIITASQLGDDTYNQAEDVSQTLTVISTLKVKYQDGDNNLTNNNIKPNLTIYNEGSVSIPYNELTLRYWVTPENYTGINTWIDHAQLGNNKVKMKYVALPEPRNGAYGYVEYGFEATAGNLLAAANSGTIQSRFANSNWANLNENDDYSHTNASAFAYNEHITMYRNGKLVWGVEPAITPAVVDLKVYTESKSSATSNAINTYLKINNEGNVPVNYGDVKVRYWFTKEGTSNLNYYSDYVVLGNSNIESGFVNLNPVQNAANTYLELGMKSSLGTFYPSSSTGNIQYRIAKSDWSNFNQLNDHSYNANTTMALNDKVTVYYQGQLIYGTEPTVTTTSKIASEEKTSENKTLTIDEDNLETIMVYPNPVINVLNVKVSELKVGSKLEIYSFLGTKVRSQTFTSSLQEISLEGLPSGSYLLYIINGYETTIKNIIKK